MALSDAKFAVIKQNGVNYSVVSGRDGKDAYVHIRWGTSATPSELLTTPNDYMGVYSGFLEEAPTTYASYQWYKVKGEKGDPGEDGEDGEDGAYVYIRWATSFNPSEMFTEPKDYAGVYTGPLKEAPTSPADYVWFRVKGDPGEDGAYVHIRWGTSATPSELLTTPSDYMGVYSGSSKTAPTTYTGYQWYKIKGGTGGTGDDGASAYVHIRWGTSLTPAELLTTPADYIGIYSGDSPNAPANYSGYQWYKYRGEKGDKGDPGDPGEDGTSNYIHIRWGTSATPSELLTTPAAFMGIYTGELEEAPTTYTAYDWFEIGSTGGNVWLGSDITPNEDGTVNATLLDEEGNVTGEVLENIILLNCANTSGGLFPPAILGYVTQVDAINQRVTVMPFGVGTKLNATYYTINPKVGNTVIATYQNGKYVAVVLSDTVYDPGTNTYIISAKEGTTSAT
jgi:hypothetical protein